MDFLSHQIWQCHWRAAAAARRGRRDDDGVHRDLLADEAAWKLRPCAPVLAGLGSSMRSLTGVCAAMLSVCEVV